MHHIGTCLSCSCAQARSHSRPSLRHPGSKRATGHSSRARNAPAIELVQALLQQAQKDTLPWLIELLQPWDPAPISIPETRPPRELAAPESKFVEVDGIEVHYFEAGTPTPDLPTVVCWHGFNGSVFNWRYVLKEVRNQHPDGCHVIAFDRPPFGLTERPLEVAGRDTNPYSSDGALAIARGLLQAKHVRRAVHAGHSQGASLAMQYALRHPEDVAGLMLVSPAISVDARTDRKPDGGALLRFLYIRAVLSNRTLGLRYVRRRILERTEGVREKKYIGRFDRGRVSLEDIEYYLLPGQADNWDVGALENFKTFEFGSAPDFDSLRLPVLIVQGDDDTITPGAFVGALAARLRQRPDGSVEYKQLKECGHLPMEEYPKQVAEWMFEYATRCTEAPNAGVPATGEQPDGTPGAVPG